MATLKGKQPESNVDVTRKDQVFSPCSKQPSDKAKNENEIKTEKKAQSSPYQAQPAENDAEDGISQLKKEDFTDDHMIAERFDTSPVPVADRPTKELSHEPYIPDDSSITISSHIQNKGSDWKFKGHLPEDKAAAKITIDSAKQLAKKKPECQSTETFRKETGIPDEGPKGGCEYSILQSAQWISEIHRVVFPDGKKDILTKHRWSKDLVDKIKNTCRAVKDKRNKFTHDLTKNRKVSDRDFKLFVRELLEGNFITFEQDKSNLEKLFHFLKTCELTKYEHKIKLNIL